MSRWILACATCALALSAPGGVLAQDDRESANAVEAQLIQHIDSLLPLAQAARVEAERAVEERQERKRLASAVGVDTIVVEGLRVIALPEQSELARTMFTDVLEEFRPFFGSPSYERSIMAFQWTDDFQPIYLEGVHHWRVDIKHWQPAAIVENTIRSSIGRMLLTDFTGTALSSWVGTPVVKPTDLSRTYRELATTASLVTTACLEGDGHACWTALDIDRGDLLDWYSPQERREMVIRELSRYSSRTVSDKRFAPCTIDADYAACDRLLAEREWFSRSYAPVSQEGRMAMVWLAIERGGEGAWERVLGSLDRDWGAADKGPEVARALQNASGMTPEELGAAWREMVLQHKPLVYASIPVHWTALMWIVLFAALAMRSTRWRLG